ncbi:hypothetical protein [Methanoculleus sp.]|uniref:hypothetical protein n=1 Tax=Methanoculleus sp. TaxID=90427 RepID=UPI0025E9F936|nr:hypothetical protein [Methanoculleus sp.]
MWQQFEITGHRGTGHRELLSSPGGAGAYAGSVALQPSIGARRLPCGCDGTW